MYLADCHVHSRCSHDGRASMSEMALAAAAAGMDAVCFTDHVDVYSQRWEKPEAHHDWQPHVEEHRQAAEAAGDRLRVGWGMELGEMIVDFSLAETYLGEMPPADFVIGSLHVMGEAFGRRDFGRLTEADRPRLGEMMDTYFEELLAHARWGKFSVMGHISLPVRYTRKLLGEEMDLTPWREPLTAVLRTLIEKGLGIEYNTTRGDPLACDRMILSLYRSLGGEILTLGSDAHRPQDIGRGIAEGQALLRELGFSYFCTYEERKPVFRKL